MGTALAERCAKQGRALRVIFNELWSAVEGAMAKSELEGICHSGRFHVGLHRRHSTCKNWHITKVDQFADGWGMTVENPDGMTEEEIGPFLRKIADEKKDS